MLTQRVVGLEELMFVFVCGGGKRGGRRVRIINVIRRSQPEHNCKLLSKENESRIHERVGGIIKHRENETLLEENYETAVR